MALYTSVQGDYDVKAFRSFKNLWDAIDREHRPAISSELLFLDSDSCESLSKNALRNQLKEHGVAWIFELNQSAWMLEIKAHAI